MEQVDESDVEKESPNHLILAEHGIVEEPKQTGDAGGRIPKYKLTFGGKYLLHLPWWYQNHTVVSKFDIVDAPSRLKRLSKDISLKTRQMIGVFDPLWPFFELR